MTVLEDVLNDICNHFEIEQKSLEYDHIKNLIDQIKEELHKEKILTIFNEYKNSNNKDIVSFYVLSYNEINKNKVPIKKRLKPIVKDERMYYVSKYFSKEWKQIDEWSEKYEKEWVERYRTNIPKEHLIERVRTNFLTSGQPLEYMKRSLDFITGYEYDNLKADILEKDIDTNFHILKDKPLELMKKFYKYVDKWGESFKRYIPCKKGCLKCCKIPVAVSKIEVLIIKQYLETNRITGYKYILENNIENKNKEFVGEEYNGIKCPFFTKDNECYIYNARPFRCRYHFVNADDNSKCGDGEEKVAAIISYIIEKRYEEIVLYYYDRKRIDINYQKIDVFDLFNDIRDNFSDFRN